MTSRNSVRYTLLNAATVRTITSSTNAAPIVVTLTAHGFSTGDRVTINGHATNTAANGTWVATKVTDNSFSLDDSTGNGIGGATGCAALAAKIIFTEDFKNVVFNIDTDGGGDAAMTLKFCASDGISPTSDLSPDFAGTKGPSNAFDFIEVVDLEDGSTIDGDTGFVVATADNNVAYEANINGRRWMTVLPTAGTAGEVTITARLFDNQ